jgi:uncharacterized protein YecE (DUF72 family)
MSESKVTVHCSKKEFAVHLSRMQSESLWKALNLPSDISGQGALVGSAGFVFRDWVGRFYPPVGKSSSKEKVSTREWFKFYQTYFSFLEIGHTFYQEPQLQQFVELERSSKTSMRFSVKVNGEISNKGKWDPTQGKSLMQKHIVAVSPLSETGRLHSLLIQLEEGVERNRKVLDYLLGTASVAISNGVDVHVEFRNHTWHQESVLQALKDSGIGICNTEIPKLAHVFPLKSYVTSDKGYVRYSGLNLEAWEAAEGSSGISPSERLQLSQERYNYLYSRKELEDRIRGQLKIIRKVSSTAIVFANHNEAKSIVNAIQNIDLLQPSQRKSGSGTREFPS